MSQYGKGYKAAGIGMLQLTNTDDKEIDTVAAISNSKDSTSEGESLSEPGEAECVQCNGDNEENLSNVAEGDADENKDDSLAPELDPPFRVNYGHMPCMAYTLELALKRVNSL